MLRSRAAEGIAIVSGGSRGGSFSPEAGRPNTVVSEGVMSAMARRPSLSAARHVAGVAAVLAATSLAGANVDASLQFASVLVARDLVRVSLYTMPGPGFAERTIALLDGNRDGTFSPAEDKAYAMQAFREIGLKVDGKPAKPHLIRVNNSTPREIRGGAGSIEMVFYIALPERLGKHTVVWENRHLPFVARREFSLLNDKDPGLVILSNVAKPDGSWAKVVYDLRKEPKYFDTPPGKGR